MKEIEQDSFHEYFSRETVIEDISRNFNDYGFGMFMITDLLLQCAPITNAKCQQDIDPIKSSQDCVRINPVNEESPNSVNSSKRKSVFRNFLTAEKIHFSNILQEILRKNNEETHRASKYVT